jgi:hypothetical protein
VSCAGPAALLKVYFQHPDDPRDRLDAEFAFCRFAWQAGLRCVPQPLACNRERKLGLYEFIEGQAPAPGDVAWPMVQQAMDFFRELNRHRTLPAAQALPIASEACFTLAQHLHCVERRLARLQQLDRTALPGKEAAALVDGQLHALWGQIQQKVLAQAAQWSLPPEEPIVAEDRCLSPSDFGFHNALVSGGRLRFVDFEYAGWDDPAKTVCDFFCQPAVPVPAEHFDRVAAALTGHTAAPQRSLERAALLLPVYQIKWCCIMLNDFLPVGNERRAFARESDDQESRRRAQLQKVRLALRRIRS